MAAVSVPMLQREVYCPPRWVSKAVAAERCPKERIRLGMLPTPVHAFQPPGLPDGVRMFIKRDDLSGCQLSGNKVRKLEFILSDAVAAGADTVVTIGGIQSNHTRATAVAARYVGLASHLVLRTSSLDIDKDPGLVGNLLVERMVGAQIHLCTKQEYGKFGSEFLGEKVVADLKTKGHTPYLIPVGGSSAIGSWGYLQMVAELEEQIKDNTIGLNKVDDIVVACGSGGTIAGLSLGVRLSEMECKVHAFGVCDSPKYFYDYVDGLLAGMGCDAEKYQAAELFTAFDAKGSGYAISTDAELKYCQEVALKTGIVFDPVYSGKALFNLVREMNSNPSEWSGRDVLFIHTGGLLGMYDKQEQLLPLVKTTSSVTRMAFD